MQVPNHITRRAREQFLADGADGVRGRLRDHIITSWQRSRLSGAPTSIQHPRYQPHINPEHRLIRAATPVLDELAKEIEGEKFCIFLGDANAHILDRRVGEWMLQDQLDAVYAAQGFIYDEVEVGTNGMGTAIEDARAVHVLGAEHYAEELAEFTCVGMPIHNPFKGNVEGAIDLTCPVAATSRLMMPLIRDAAAEVQQGLYEQSTTTERFLLQQFLKWTKRSPHPVIVLNETLLLSNPKAARLLSNTDQHLLWDQAVDVIRRQQSSTREIALASGHDGVVHCRPLFDGGEAMGAIVTIKPAPSRPGPSVEVEGDEVLSTVAGRAPAWRRATAEAERHVHHGAPLLLCGEAGVGKCALARALHHHVGTPSPFIVCEAVELVADPVSVLDRFHTGGTLVVRHLENLDTAGLHDLHGLVEGWLRTAGIVLMATHTVWRFELGTSSDQREAAISTLGFAAVELPPLRERRQDVPALIEALLAATDQGGYRIADEAAQLLSRVELPGNVTELRTILERSMATARGRTIKEDDLPDDVRARAARRRLTPYEQAELHAVLHALRDAGGNKKRAAQMLGLSRSTLYRKMRSFGVGAEHLGF